MKKLSKIFGLIMILALFLILPSCEDNGGASLEDCEDACAVLNDCSMLDEMGFDNLDACIAGCVVNAEQEQVDCILEAEGCIVIWLCFADQDCIDACSKLEGCALFDDLEIDNYQDCLFSCMEDENKEIVVNCIDTHICNEIVAACFSD